MKTSNVITLLLVGSLSSVLIVEQVYMTYSAKFTPDKIIEGNGIPGIREITLPALSGLAVGQAIEAQIFINPIGETHENKVIIYGDNNLLPLAEVTNKDKTTSVFMNGFSSKNRIRMDFYFDALPDIRVAQSASVTFTDDRYVYTRLSINAQESSTCSIDANFSGDICVSSKAAASVTLKGEAQSVNITAKTGSKVDALGMEVDEASLSAHSGGSVSATVYETVKLDASSGGAIYLQGDPLVDEKKITSGGSLEYITKITPQ